MPDGTGKPYVRRLSEHFVNEWTQHVGFPPPTLGELNAILAESYRLNGQRRIFVKSAEGEFKPDMLLAQFWNHDKGVIIRVDFTNSTAVTVIVPRSKRLTRQCAEASG